MLAFGSDDPSLRSGTISGLDLVGIAYRLCNKLLILAPLSSLCYNDRTEAGGGVPRANTVVLRVCRAGCTRDLGIGLRLVFGGGEKQH